MTLNELDKEASKQLAKAEQTLSRASHIRETKIALFCAGIRSIMAIAFALIHISVILRGILEEMRRNPKMRGRIN